MQIFAFSSVESVRGWINISFCWHNIKATIVGEEIWKLLSPRAQKTNELWGQKWRQFKGKSMVMKIGYSRRRDWKDVEGSIANE